MGLPSGWRWMRILGFGFGVWEVFGFVKRVSEEEMRSRRIVSGFGDMMYYCCYF